MDFSNESLREIEAQARLEVRRLVDIILVEEEDKLASDLPEEVLEALPTLYRHVAVKPSLEVEFGPMAPVAQLLEYGTPTTDARSFLTKLRKAMHEALADALPFYF